MFVCVSCACVCMCRCVTDGVDSCLVSGASFVSDSNANGCADADVNSNLTACGDVDSQPSATQPSGMLNVLNTSTISSLFWPILSVSLEVLHS